MNGADSKDLLFIWSKWNL